MATYEGQQTLREILEWVVAHRKDTSAMDKISRLVYPYTTHYIYKTLDSAEGEDGKSTD